jgi:Ca-activated chloride channel family protein
VNTFYRYIDRAVLTDLRVTWGDLGAAELFPNPIPDLFASHPVIVHGRYKHLGDGPVKLHARLGEEDLELDVEVKKTLASGTHGGVLGSLWARSKVEFLQEEGWIGMRPDAPQKITQLGLEYELVTPYTSFVAVDESRIVGDGKPEKIVQPVEVPEAVDGAMAGARTRAPVTSLSQPPATTPMAPAPPPAAQHRYRQVEESKTVDAPVAYGSPGGDAAPSPEPAEDMEVHGCRCRAAGHRSAPTWPVIWAGLGLAALLWRRRRT